jgi:hypothetical protein
MPRHPRICAAEVSSSRYRASPGTVIATGYRAYQGRVRATRAISTTGPAWS